MYDRRTAEIIRGIRRDRIYRDGKKKHALHLARQGSAFAKLRLLQIAYSIRPCCICAERGLRGYGWCRHREPEVELALFAAEERANAGRL